MRPWVTWVKNAFCHPCPSMIKGRSACATCVKKMCRLSTEKCTPRRANFLADLPEDRLIPKKPPFAFATVGVDYFGPLEVKQGRSSVTRYRCLFTCLTTRAVLIEIAHSFGTDAMVMHSEQVSGDLSVFVIVLSE